ncbi:MAG TPA: Gmad2 immunoglobulin-like domain-containing protein [Candidatus Dormibacteraeota bacterium]|nr:Gmad2 immunoglobulin-like domain-containing protein [Candidatus Dormibacteraeota bacterium]
MGPEVTTMATLRPSRVALATLSLGALLSACGGSGGPAGPSTPTPAPTATPAPTEQPTATPTPQATPTPTEILPTPAPTPVATTTTSVYFLRDGRVMPVHRIVSPASPAWDSLVALLAGPTSAEAQQGFTSAVATAQRVLSVSIANGVATVDFAARAPTGAGLAEVVYTLTQFRTVQSVAVRVDGAPLAAGLTRGGEEQWTPAIFVEAPVVGQSAGSPLRVWGTANTFEAAFRIRLTTSSGVQLFDYPVQATSGTGTRGTFDVTVRFTVSGAATLQLYEVSMKDGSHVNVVTIPLTLQP